jgi:hypothetical protein
MCTVSVGSETGMDIKARLSAGDHEQHVGRRDCSQHLRNDVGNEIRGGKAFPYNQAQADGGIQVTTGNVSDGIHHGQHGEAEGQGNASESDAKRGEACGDDSCAASAEYQPESSKELREGTFPQSHKISLHRERKWIFDCRAGLNRDAEG